MKKTIQIPKDRLKDSPYRKMEVEIGITEQNGFSVICSLWNKGRKLVDISGTCPEEVKAYGCDALKFIQRLHYSSINGYPMYYIQNGFYHVHTSRIVALEYLRITEKEYAELFEESDEQSFGYKLAELGIMKRWREEALEAIKLFKEL